MSHNVSQGGLTRFVSNTKLAFHLWNNLPVSSTTIKNSESFLPQTYITIK